MSQSFARALPVVAVLSLGPGVTAQQTPAPVPSVTVTGEVNHPGSLDWTPQLTVQAAITATGGLTDHAAKNLLIERHSNTMTMTTGGYTALLSRALEPGDKLIVARRPFDGAGPRVLVTGALAAPGTYTLTSGVLPLSAAITAAGGFTPDAGDDIQVWRRPGPYGSAVAPIIGTTPAAEVVIVHTSRRAFEDNRSSSAQFALSGDDQAVVVPRRDQVTYLGGSASVTGDVRKAGVVHSDRLSLRTALVAASGPTSDSPERSITISHAAGQMPDGGGRETVTYRDIADGSLDLPLRDGDTVRVARPIGAGGDFTTDNVPATPQLVQWQVGMPPPGRPAGETAQEVLRARNSHAAMPVEAPSAPLDLTDMAVERQVGDQLELLRATPALVLEPADLVLVMKRPQGMPPRSPDLTAMARTWAALDRSRSLTLQVENGGVTGVLTENGASTRVVGDSLAEAVVLQTVTTSPKGGLAPDAAIGAICVVYFGASERQLIGRTDTLHAGVEGLHYLTRENWRGRAALSRLREPVVGRDGRPTASPSDRRAG